MSRSSIATEWPCLRLMSCAVAYIPTGKHLPSCECPPPPEIYSRDDFLAPDPSVENQNWGRGECLWPWTLRESILTDPMRLYLGVQLAVSFLIAMPAFTGGTDLCSHFLATQMHGHSVFSQAPPSAVKAVRAESSLPPEKKTQNKCLQLWFDCKHNLVVHCGLHAR